MKKKSLTLNSILNVIKSLSSIIFPLITFPYATRILGKENFGKVNFGSSIISYISLLASLGIANYAIREGSRVKNDKEQLQKLSSELFSINIISMIFAYFILFILLIFWKKLDGYSALLLIQALSVIFTTIGTDWINSIFEDYLYITLRYIITQILSLILMFVFVKTNQDYLLYAFITIFSSIMANILNFIYVRKKYNIYPRFILNTSIKKHIKPILILFGTAISAIIYVNSDITILGVIKGEAVVGTYSVAAKVYSIVKQILNAMLVVSIPRVSFVIVNKTKKEVEDLLERIIGLIILLIGPAITGLFMLSDRIILLLSDNDYIAAVPQLKILSISLIFATMVTFYIYVILIPFKKEKIALIATLISAILNLIFNFILIPKYGANAAAFTTLVSEFVTMAIGLYYSNKIINIKLIKPIFICCINSLFTYLVCIITNSLDLNNVFIVVLSIIISGIICFFVSYLMCLKNEYNN